MNKRITGVTVTLEDGTTEQWVGTGAVRSTVTEPKGGAEGSVRFVVATLQYDPTAGQDA